MRIFLTFALLQISFTVFSQTPTVPEDVYGLKNPNADGGKSCLNCQQVLRQKPADVQFGFVVENNDIYFILTDSRWLNQLFTKNSDGIAVDIINRDQFSCKLKTNRVGKHWAYKGFLLKPVYLKDFKNEVLLTGKGEVFIKVGSIPPHLIGKDLEFNMLIINNKNVCHYNAFFDIPWDRWSLLEMGLFMDTIPSKVKAGEKEMASEKFLHFSKQMKFEIPFEKNKYEYSPADIKPLSDSLRLNDYEIKNITIRAYSSVEGTTERNIELQQKRAESIIKILQSYQTGTIIKDIHASENWVEFLENVGDTKHAYMKALSKEEIKLKLENKQISSELELILKNHRKAILMIELEKKMKLGEDSVKLKTSFEKAILNKNIEEAKEIQEIIFSKIRNKSLSMGYLKSIEIPEKYEFGNLLFNYAIFNYEENESDIYKSISLFEKLQLLMPGNKNIKYNLTALKIKSWVYSPGSVDAEDLKKEITALEKIGIDQSLIKRMMINYHIIRSEYQMAQKNYAEKDKSIKYIQTQFSTVTISEKDALNLARYFASYTKYEWAETLLKKYVTKVDVGEDLLFYYINLTIIDPKKTATPQYRTIMLNAININKVRFCKLFNTFGKEGITFQLLDDQYLKKMYCEGCQ